MYRSVDPAKKRRQSSPSFERNLIFRDTQKFERNKYLRRRKLQYLISADREKNWVLGQNLVTTANCRNIFFHDQKNKIFQYKLYVLKTKLKKLYLESLNDPKN